MQFEFLNQLLDLFQKSQFYIKPWLEILLIIWCINILNWMMYSKLNNLGIYPRSARGLLGIFFSPFLHGNFSHLLFNSIPLFFLGLAILAREGALMFCWITLVIAVVGGLGVWLFGRKAIHIGASGVISGYFGYILMTAYTEKSAITILYAVFAVYYFGGILIGLLPGKKQVSWEGHLFGFMGGVLCAYIPNGLLYFIH